MDLNVTPRNPPALDCTYSHCHSMCLKVPSQIPLKAVVDSHSGVDA